MAALRLAPGILVLALLLPFAAAAPASGALDVGGAMRFTGNLAADAGAGDLLWNASSPPALDLQGTTIHVERFGSSQTIGKGPVGPGIGLTSNSVDQKADFPAGRLTLGQGEGAQMVGLAARGAVHLESADAEVRGVSSALMVALEGDAQHLASHCTAMRCLAALGAYEVAGARDAGTFSGALTLFLRGPTLQVADGSGGTTTFASGHSEQSNGATTQVEETWVVVTLQQGTGGFSGASTKAAYLEAPRLAGALVTIPVATGSVHVGGKSYNAQGEALEAGGALRIALSDLARPDTLADEGKTAYASGFHADMAGDVATINLHEAPVLSQAPAEAAGLAALGVAAAAAVAYYWPLLAFHAAALAAPLYTRLRQPEILDNDVRNRIYDIIRANPGISARAVHRESAQSWGTVVYHLRQLERHHLVVSRTLGRTRNYYENHGKYRGMEVQLACLQAPRALALARVVLAHPGVTQEELVAASGFPQPTTSYYVRKLRKAGLVDEAREGRYVRYLPATDLGRFVETAESGLVVGAPHASGVNA